MSEIRRLQRIAGGRPTRADTVRKSKGILYLVIIGAILLYSWNWKRLYENRSLQKVAQSEISFEAFQALFGAASTLSEKEKDQEFEGYKGKTVAWQGKVIYINREGPAPHLNLRQGAGAKALDVVLRFTEKTRTQLTDIREGEQIRYTGKILNFDSSNAYITLNHGMILSVE
ncbi:MAG: hypothetical protein O2954_04615 [bacterium]|nr:hypothetical protein [bacterium]